MTSIGRHDALPRRLARREAGHFLFLGGQLGVKMRQLLLLVLLEALERLALLVAIHGIALHEDLEVDQRGVELRSIHAGELALVAEQPTAISATTFNDTGLTASTTYYYVVEATNTNGTSIASNQASAATPAAPVEGFTLGVAPPSLTLTAGTSRTETVTVTPVNGFPTTSTVTFACSNLPANASCSFAPTSVQAGNIVSTLTVNTTTASAALHFNSGPLFPGSALAVALCFLGWKKRRGVQLMLLLAVSVIGLALFNGCGGSSRTPVTSTVTVTAASGTLQQTATFSLTVK